MPTISRKILSRLRRLNRRLNRTPFARLVRHFLVRMVREGHTDSTEFQLGVGPLLGLLAAPGACLCFLMLNNYSSLLNWFRGRLREDLLVASAPDKYLFLSIAMGITGIVTVLKWDRTLPDSQDYLNLAPLPLRPRDILFANATAIGIAVVVLALDVSGLSVVLFPLFVTAAMPSATNAIGFMATHALCAMLASLFAFCAVFAILGTLAATLPRDLFRAGSSWLRGILLVAFMALLPTGFAAPAVIRRLETAPDSLVRLLPPLWYLSLYQSLQHRASTAMAKLAPMAGLSLAVAFGLMVLAYGLSYGRRFAGVLEGGRPAPGWRGLRWALAFLDCFAYRASGFGRASYRFVIRALLRNEAQRFWISVSLALGCFLAFQLDSIAAPLVAAYLLILGLRLAFEIPAALPANWVFRSTLNCREHESLGVARRVMVAFVTLLVLLPSLAFLAWRQRFPVAFLQTVYVLVLSLCLIEFLLAGYRKIPCTSPTPGFRENLPLRCFLLLFGLVGFARLGAGMERWMLVEPVRFLAIPAAMAAAWFWNQARLGKAREAGEIEEGLSFESGLTPAVLRLKLLDGE